MKPLSVILIAFFSLSCTKITVTSHRTSFEPGSFQRVFVAVLVDKSLERNIEHFRKSFSKISAGKDFIFLVDGSAYDADDLSLSSQKTDFSKQIAEFRPQAILTIRLIRRMSERRSKDLYSLVSNIFQVTLFTESPDKPIWMAEITVKTAGNVLTNADVNEIVGKLFTAARQQKIFVKD